MQGHPVMTGAPSLEQCSLLMLYLDSGFLGFFHSASIRTWALFLLPFMLLFSG